MIKRVEKYKLLDGSIYTGNYDDINHKPVGSGFCSYPDGHSVWGTFIGIPNGPCYVNYDSWMQLGYFSQGKLQGWGMQMGKGNYHFGVFHDGKLIKDCPVLFDEIHERITLMSRSLKAKGINVRWAHRFIDNNGVYFGVFEKGYKKVGIRFLPSGDVYIGMSDNSIEMTGTFVHLKDSSIEAGVFKDGKLIQETKNALFHCASWVEILRFNALSFDSRSEIAFEISKITRDNVMEYLREPV